MAAPEELCQAEVDIFREISKRWLHFFTVFVLRRDRLGGINSFHWDFCKRLEKIKKPQFHLYYRKAFKSTICGVAYPLWEAARDPENWTYLKLVEDLDLGMQQMLAIREQMESNPILRRLFPELSPHPRDFSGPKASIIGRDYANMGSTFELRTLRQGRAGRHVGCIHVDDLVNEANWMNRNDQVRLWRQLKAIWPTLDDGIKLLLTGTRWADYDVWGEAIRAWYPLDMDVFIQPVRGNAHIRVDDYRTIVEDDGVYAHPEEWNDEVYNTERRRTADEYFWNCQYMLDTTHKGILGFSADDIIYVPDEVVARTPMTIYIAADPASGTGSSRPAITVCGIDADGFQYPLWANDEYTSELDFIESLFGAFQAYKPLYVFMEKYGQGGQSMEQQIDRHSRESGIYLPLMPVTHGHQDKDSHILHSMRPQYQRGRVKHPERMRHSHYESQLLAYPGGEYEDMVDAMAYGFRESMRYGFVGNVGDRQGDAKLVTCSDIPRGYTLEELLDPRLVRETHEASEVSIW